MMMHTLFCIMVFAGLFPACSQLPTSSAAGWVHFFSVAWGCVEVEKSKLNAASYTIQDFETKTGACPASLTILNSSSQQLLECPVVVGPKAIPATYILFDKRSLDGKTLSDLRAEGFTVDTFCPEVAKRSFK